VLERLCATDSGDDDDSGFIGENPVSGRANAGQAINVNFSFASVNQTSGEVQKSTLSVPVLTIVPIPFIRVRAFTGNTEFVERCRGMLPVGLCVVTGELVLDLPVSFGGSLVADTTASVR
jgi:hypothetical protein